MFSKLEIIELSVKQYKNVLDNQRYKKDIKNMGKQLETVVVLYILFL